MVSHLSLTIAVLLSALNGWSLLWQWSADSARSALLDGPSRAVSTPAAIDHGAVTIRGDAPRARLILTDVAISGTVEGQDWTWQAGDVIVAPGPAGSPVMRVVLPGPQRLTMAGPHGGGVVTLWATNLSARLGIGDDGMVVSTTVDGDRLTVTGLGLDSTAESVHMALERAGNGVIRIDLALDQLALPPSAGLAAPMGAVVQRAALAAWVSGLGPPEPATAAAWREDAGVIGISDLSLRWGTVNLAANGRLSLDSGLRPEGRLTFNLAGVADAVAAAHGSGVISREFHDQALQGLARISALRGGQANPDLNVAFTMAGGYLSWAGLPIARLPTFAGPAGPIETDAGPARYPAPTPRTAKSVP